MSLASHLLKHLIITKYCGVSWSESTISRHENGKPCFMPSPDQSVQNHVEFNVSHQAGIVSLIAVIGTKDVNVGTDIVCANERIQQDYKYIEKDGFFDWVHIHGDVFAESEISFMKLGPVELPELEMKGYGKDATSRCQWRNRTLEITVGEEEQQVKVQMESNLVIDAKLRRFYAMWCLREAYVKMTGEALLAPWLKDLEISAVRVPAAKVGLDTDLLEEGEVVEDFSIRFKGRPVTNVEMELSALGSDYIIGGAVRGAKELGLKMGKWKELDLEADILAFGAPMS